MTTAALGTAISLWFYRVVVCRVRGHMWDSDRPAGPIGYDPDRCWRCESVR